MADILLAHEPADPARRRSPASSPRWHCGSFAAPRRRPGDRPLAALAEQSRRRRAGYVARPPRLPDRSRRRAHRWPKSAAGDCSTPAMCPSWLAVVARRDPARPRHLPAARPVPRRAGLVAAAPHASRRPRVRRNHRRALPSDRDSALDGDQARRRRRARRAGGGRADLRGAAQRHVDVQPRQRAAAGGARPRAALARRHARHAPRPPFDRAPRDQQQFRLQPALVGPAVRHLPRPAGRPATRHDDRHRAVPRSAPSCGSTACSCSRSATTMRSYPLGRREPAT